MHNKNSAIAAERKTEAGAVINKPNRNWNIGAQGQLICRPHLLLLGAIWRKTRFWNEGNFCSASSRWSMLTGTPTQVWPFHLALFCTALNAKFIDCICSWDAAVLGIKRKTLRYSMYAKQMQWLIFLWKKQVHTRLLAGNELRLKMKEYRLVPLPKNTTVHWSYILGLGRHHCGLLWRSLSQNAV